MTNDEELQEAFSSRLHGLVAHPPAGRNLMPGIRKAAHRRRTRVAAVSSTLGVTGVVVAGAVTSSSLRGTPAGQPVQAAASTASSAPLVATAAPSPAAPTTHSAPPPSAAVVQSPTPSLGTPTPAPTVVIATPPTDPSVVAAAPFYYSHLVNEQFGIRQEHSGWAGQFTGGHSAVTPTSGMHPVSPVAPTAFTFLTTYNTKLTWADFSIVPSAATLHEWMYGTPEQSRHFFGVDLTGTARGDQYAFEEGIELINGTPSTPAFRLAVIAAVAQVAGVVVSHGVTDEVGRTGTQLALKAGGDVGAAGSTNEDIVDPNDGRLLQGTLSDDSACHDGNVFWRGVYLEQGAVPDDHTIVAPTVAPPTGHAASCLLPGEQTPPGTKP